MLEIVASFSDIFRRWFLFWFDIPFFDQPFTFGQIFIWFVLISIGFRVLLDVRVFMGKTKNSDVDNSNGEGDL